MGHVFKLVNNFLSATHGVIAAEAMAFGVKAGADPEKLFQVISDGSGNSYMFQMRVANMLKGSKDVLTLPIEGLFKDLEAVTSYAKQISMPLLFPVIAQQVHLDGMASGLGKKDPSAFSELYEQRYGIRMSKKSVD
jgi:putative dehydrogenase